MYRIQATRAIGPIDQMFKPFFWCYLLCFPLPGDKIAPARALLQACLSRLVAERPYLAGTVKRVPESSIGRNHIHLASSPGVDDLRLVTRDLTDAVSGWTETYEALKAANFPLHKLDSRIIAPLTAGVEETRQVMAVQANFIPGGLILAMCFHHNFVDGGGAARVISRFSEHCAGAAGTEVVEANGLDEHPASIRYETVQAAYKFDDLKDDPVLWRLNCLDPNPPPEGHKEYQWPPVIPSLPPPSDPPIVSTMFGFPPAALKEIKAAAQPEDGASWVSSNDAFVAFIWRHILRARYPWCANDDEAKAHEDRKSSAIVALDGRKDLGVPPSYVGNCVFHAYTDLTVKKAGSPSTKLSELAASIRQGVTRARGTELLKRVVGLAATIPDVSTVRYGNDNLGTDVYTTSWTALPFYSLDWGILGRVEFLRVPDRHFETLCCILPPREGVVELIVSMRRPDAERLKADKDFTRLAVLI